MSGRYARIAGVGGHLPQRVVENSDLQAFVETSDEWIHSRTGIRRRHLAADGELSSDLALPAARQALSRAGIDAAALDMIIFATTTPDRIYPATACLLQAKLGIAGCAAFDVQAVCSGFLYALSIGEAMIGAGRANTVLVIGAEVYSHILDWQDRGTCVLFGDGGGAAVLTAADAPGILAAHLHADGRYADKLTVNAHVKNGELLGDAHTRMDGSVVYRFAVDKMSRTAQTAAAGGAIDWLVLHQANSRIIDAVRKRLQVAEEKTLMTVGEHGNTSAASIPLLLNAEAARFKPGDRLLMAAVGGGFTWGAVYLEWS